jgi:hypothetical protein
MEQKGLDPKIFSRNFFFMLNFQWFHAKLSANCFAVLFAVSSSEKITVYRKILPSFIFSQSMCELYEHRIPRNAVRYQFIAKTEKVLQTGRPEANPTNYTVHPGESSLVCSLFNTFSSINLRTLLSFYFIRWQAGWHNFKITFHPFRCSNGGMRMRSLWHRSPPHITSGNCRE